MIEEKARQIVNAAETEVEHLFKKTDEIAEYNQKRCFRLFKKIK